MKSILTLAAVMVLVFGAVEAKLGDPSGLAGQEVDLQLVLAADASGSVGRRLGNEQRRGFAAAFRDPALQRAISSGLIGRVAVTYFEWAGVNRQQVIVPWQIIATIADMERFAETLETAPETAGGGETSISDAMMFASKLFDESGLRSLRKVVDISGNGRNSQGPDVAVGLRALLERGATVNGLALPRPDTGPFGALFASYDGPVVRYYRENVIAGPGAFAIEVDPLDGLVPAILRKLVLEVAWAVPRTTYR